jgi:hypothetical protein
MLKLDIWTYYYLVEIGILLKDVLDILDFEKKIVSLSKYQKLKCLNGITYVTFLTYLREGMLYKYPYIK